jgi:hypothetical protein
MEENNDDITCSDWQDKDYKKNIESAPNFVLETEKLISRLAKKDIQEIRNKFQELIEPKEKEE